MGAAQGSAAGHCCSSPAAAEAAGPVEGRIAGDPAAAAMADFQGMAGVASAAVAGDTGETGPAGRQRRSAGGLDGIRILGRHRWGAAAEGGTGFDNHRPAAVAGVATSATPTCPRWWTTLSGCGPGRTGAGERTRSLSAIGREGGRRRRCWRRQHPAAGSCRLHTVAAAAAAVVDAAAVAAAVSRAASGRAGSRPWLAVTTHVSVAGAGRGRVCSRFFSCFPRIPGFPSRAPGTPIPRWRSRRSDGGSERRQGVGIAIKSGEGMNLLVVSFPTAHCPLPTFRVRRWGQSVVSRQGRGRGRCVGSVGRRRANSVSRFFLSLGLSPLSSANNRPSLSPRYHGPRLTQLSTASSVEKMDPCRRPQRAVSAAVGCRRVC